MKKRSKLLLGLLVVGVAIAVGVTVSGPKDESEKYQWDLIGKGDIRETITASGEIQARVKVNVGTSIIGEIKILHVQDGQEVKAGDMLVTIDQEKMRQALLQAKAALDGARKDNVRQEAAKVRAEEQFERLERLYKQGLVSDEDFRQSRLARDNAVSARRIGESMVEQNIANVAVMKDALEKSSLRAPIAGRVTGLKAQKGETAIPGQSNLPGATLMVISDMKDLIAEIKVNESEVVKTKLGQSAQVTVESLPGRVFPGKLIEIATAAEKIGQDANMYLVKVALDMSSPDVPMLRPGMTTRAVLLTNESKHALRVPLQSILERDGSLEDAQKKGLLAPEVRTIVMVEQKGKAQERSVKTGIANTQFIEVKSGVAEGERVLTGPIRKLKLLRENDSVKLRQKSDAETEKEENLRKAKKP